MSFKEFVNWCNQRACDGCWGPVVAMSCIEIMGDVRKKPFWKRNKFWKSEYEKLVLDQIVNPINKKIQEVCHVSNP